MLLVLNNEIVQCKKNNINTLRAFLFIYGHPRKLALTLDPVYKDIGQRVLCAVVLNADETD